MTAKCDTCEKITNLAALHVYALPGIPMSVGNCKDCFIRDAYPLSIARANTEAIGGLDQAAEWWREAMTYKDGQYMTIEAALTE